MKTILFPTYTFVSNNIDIVVVIIGGVSLTYSLNFSLCLAHTAGNRLKGTIPVEIGEYKLESLNLNSNQIVGHIPATLVKSNANMILLALQHNDLTGTIPQWMGSMTEMEVLYLGNNKFAGSLPAEMAQMSSLQSLALSKNELLGDLSVLQALPSLSHIYADRNLFEGTLQETFDYMPQLKELDMSSNKLKGTLPEYFFKMTNLQILDLSDNEMDGPIPNAIPEGSGLKYLSLFANGFDGTIPSSIENAQSLTHVDLSANYLQGTIPTVLGSLTNLKYLFLAENRFTAGPIPSWISNLPNLQDLSLRETGLTGSIPSFLTSMSNLILLDVQKNSLVGTIPPKRVGSGVSKLRFILLNRNQLTGTIPYEFSRLSTLGTLLLIVYGTIAIDPFYTFSIAIDTLYANRSSFVSIHYRHALGGSQFLYRKLEWHLWPWNGSSCPNGGLQGRDTGNQVRLLFLVLCRGRR